MPIKKNLDEVQIGMVLAQPVFEEKGINLISEGTVINEEYIEKLLQWQIKSVFIVTEDELIENKEAETRQLYQKVYSKATDCLGNILQNVVSEKPMNLEDIKEPVNEIMSRINENQDVFLQLTRLNKMGNHLFTHSVNVCVYALVIGRYLRFAPDQLRELGTTALLHDIGMVKINEDMWNNENPLSDKAWQQVKNHPIIGAEFLEKSPDFSKAVTDGVRHHHERLDGTGYPAGLKGGDISFYGGIVGLVNIYESLTAFRKYRNPVTPYEALKIIMNKGESHFAPEILRALVGHMAIYPIGSFVLLSTNEIARVTGATPDQPFRPRLKVLFDENHQVQISVKRIDLRNKKYETVFIRKSISEAEMNELTGVK